MSVNQRKLYPTPPNDQNDSCSDPYGCYPSGDPYSIPPQPWPPEPPSSSKGGQTISPLLIIIITVLASAFLLVIYYVLIVKYCKRWNPFRLRRRRSPAAVNEEFLDENRGPEIDHPIWYINTIGLQPSIINAITIFRYKKGDNLIEGTECAVCLNEFQNDETLRLLPKCNHAFHITCIDTWLRAHTNCPICRAGIVSNATNGLNSITIPVDESSGAENSETGELNNSDEVRDDVFYENRSDTNDATEVPGVDYDNHEAIDNDKTSADSKENNDHIIEDENHEIQSVRRSVSVDSFMAADISLAVNGLSLSEREEALADPGHQVKAQGSGEEVGANSGGQRTNSDSSITEFLRKKPVPMKRSFSYAGRSFLSRQYPRSNSVLPL